MASSAMDTLRGLLGDNADEKIKAALSSLSSASSGAEDTQSSVPVPSTTVSSVTGAADTSTIDSLMQIKDIVEHLTSNANDSRANLLMSLKPYMRSSRQGSIDKAVRMLNISKLSGLFRLR